MAMRTKWGSPRKLLAPSRLTAVGAPCASTNREASQGFLVRTQERMPASPVRLWAAVIVTVSPGGPLTCHMYPSRGQVK